MTLVAMRALALPGSSGQLEFREVPIPRAGPSRVSGGILAAPADWLFLQGAFCIEKTFQNVVPGFAVDVVVVPAGGGLLAKDTVDKFKGPCQLQRRFAQFERPPTLHSCSQKYAPTGIEDYDMEIAGAEPLVMPRNLVP